MTTRKEVLEALTKGVTGIRDDVELERMAWALTTDVSKHTYELVIKLCEKEILTTTEAVEVLR